MTQLYYQNTLVGSHVSDPTLTIHQERTKSGFEITWQLSNDANIQPESYDINYPGTAKHVDATTTTHRIPITSDNQATQKNDGAFVLTITLNYVHRITHKSCSLTKEKLIKTDLNYPHLNAEEEDLLIKILSRKNELLQQISSVRYELQLNQKEIEKVEKTLGKSSSQTNGQNQMFINHIKLFNRDPQKALKKMIDCNFIREDTPQAKAQFIINTNHDPPLSKTAVGEILGKKDNLDILLAYVEQFQYEFRDKTLLQALRFFLDRFWLPGESQQVDRIMQAFADSYTKLNLEVLSEEAVPNGIAPSPDAVYILSFAIIMLNTDLHNPNVKNKMNQKVFFSMIKENPDGVVWKDSFLQHIYRDIQQNQIKLPSQGSSETSYATAQAKVFEEPDIEGWLLFQKLDKGFLSRPKWEKKYCCISKRMLCYVDKLEDSEPKGIVPIQDLVIIDLPDDKAGRIINGFHLESTKGIKRAIWNQQKQNHEWIHDHKMTQVKFSARTPLEKSNWIKALNECLGVDSMYDLIKSKRNRMSTKLAIQ